MSAPTLKQVLAHLKKNPPRVVDAVIAVRATEILRSWGVANAHDRISRSHVCGMRNAKSKNWTGTKARAAWHAMAEMKLIPGVPIEALARAESTPRRIAGTNAYWKKQFNALKAQLAGSDLVNPVKEVPVITPPMLRYYGFERNPVYDEVMTAKDMWWGAQHKEAKEIIVDAVEEGRFVRIAGQRGAGKSLVGFFARQELATKRDDVIVVDPGAVMTGVMTELHLVTAVIQAIKRHVDGRSEVYPESGNAIRRHHAMRYLLVQQRKANRRVVLWIDEAHKLRAETFIAIKALRDEIEDVGRRLLSVVLIGQNPEAAYNPRAKDLSEVTLRIQTYRIGSMNDEMGKYLRWKVERAGASIASVITPKAIEALATRAAFPLEMNALFAQLLIDVYRDKEKPITRQHVDATPEGPEDADVEAASR